MSPKTQSVSIQEDLPSFDVRDMVDVADESFGVDTGVLKY